MTSSWTPYSVVASVLAATATFAGVGFDEGVAHAQVEVPIFVADDGEDETAAANDNLDELVVQSAAKRTESVFETASIVTVVTGDQIKAAGYRTMDDVLNAVPGFEARRGRAFWGYGPRAWGRGAGRVILYLINGVPINLHKVDIANGLEIPLMGIKRIEIISGPGGVVWGANAYLGVVNMIVEPELDGTHAEVSIAGGSGSGMRNAMISTVAGAETFADGKVRAALWFRYVSSNDFEIELPYDVQDGPSSSPRPDGTFELAPSSGGTISTRDHHAHLRAAFDIFGLRVDALLPVYTRTYNELSERGIRSDVFTNPVTGVRRETGLSSEVATQPTALSLRYGVQLGERTRVDARAYYSGYRQLDLDFVNFPPSVDPASAGGKYPRGAFNKDFTVGGIGPQDDTEYAIGAGVDFKHDVAWNSLLIGVETFIDAVVEQQYTVSGETTLGPIKSTNKNSRETAAVFVNDRVRLGQLEIEGGARLQYNVDYGAESVFSIAGLYRLAENLFMKVNYAQGFRPGPIRAMSRNDDPVTNPVAHIFGNPDLTPERSQSLEGEFSGLFFRGQGAIRYLRLAVGYQWTDLSDLIVERGERIVNSGQRTINSVESRAELRLSNVRAGVGYHWLHAVESSFGEVRNMANHKVVLTLDAKLSPRVRFYVGTTLYGAREDLNRVPYALPTMGTTELAAPASAAVIDRLAPMAEVDATLTVGGFWDGRLDFRLYTYNAINAQNYTPDEDFEKRTALLSVQAPKVAVLGGLVLRL